MNQTLLTLICPPSLERPITDWLLEHEAISGFTSLQVHGHGSDPLKLNIIEQVEGRKKTDHVSNAYVFGIGRNRNR